MTIKHARFLVDFLLSRSRAVFFLPLLAGAMGSGCNSSGSGSPGLDASRIPEEAGVGPEDAGAIDEPDAGSLAPNTPSSSDAASPAPPRTPDAEAPINPSNDSGTNDEPPVEAGVEPRNECGGDPVCESLQTLGVNTSPGTRLDRNGNQLPSTFHPLGTKQRRIEGRKELFLAGAQLFALTQTEQQVADTALVSLPVTGDPELVLEFTDTEWTSAEWHAGTTGDLDGDGVDDVVGVWRSGDQLWLRTIDGLDGTPNDQDTALGEYLPEALNVVAGDFDGDGQDEVVVAIVVGMETRLLWVNDVLTDPVPTLAMVRARSTPSPVPGVDLAAGNLDYDAAEELVVVFNEATDWTATPPLASTSFAVYDDANVGFGELASDRLTAEVGGAVRVGLSGGADIVDIDTDGVGEVVLAATLGDVQEGETTYLGNLLFILDDAAGGFSQRFADVRLSPRGVDDNQAVYQRVIVEGLDIDGDQREEVWINDRVYANFADDRFSEPWSVRNQLSIRWLWENVPINDGRQVLGFDNTAVAVGDFIGDGVDDIAFVNHSGHVILVYGMAQADVGAEPVAQGFDLQFETLENRPLLLPLHTREETTLLEFDETQSGLLFTEPIVLAALAAPPCQEDIGQNLEPCTTSWGQTESQAVTQENSITLSASVSTGISLEERFISQSSLETEFLAQTALTHTESSTYEVQKSIVYSTGIFEDAVVFTTVPYDRYAYRVLESPTEDMVGETIFVDLPRSLVTLMVERSFYNEHVVADADRIDEQVFAHTIGDRSSYRTVSERDALLTQFGGLASNPVSVSQGSGAVEVTMDVGEAHSEGQELAIGYEASVKVTGGGVMVGFSAGYENSNQLTIESGQATTYTGGVGAIDADHFASNQFDFGLFSYVYQTPSGRKFEVLDYWVE